MGTRTGPESDDAIDLVLVADPLGRPNPRLVVAASRAGALGLLELRGTGTDDLDGLTAVTGRGIATFGARVPASALADGGAPPLPAEISTLVIDGRALSPAAPEPITGAVERARAALPDGRILVETTSREVAAAALAAGADGLIGVGSEAGGRVGDTESFILLQQLLDLAAPTGAPVWIRGGVGLHTAAAAVAGGAAGVVLDGQLALTREAGLPDETAAAIGAMDGSETVVVGDHRVYTRPDLEVAQLDDEGLSAAEVATRLGADLRRDLVPIGADGALAALVARRFGTVGGAVAAVRASIASHLEAARVHQPLAPGAGVSAAHGTEHPIVQGPMTRVSDRAAFARSVADGGGLPFLALALMSGPEVRALLTETAELLGDRPWGVGILGFVPPEVRDAQLEVVHDVAPPFALIAGGRPSQAKPLEDAGIATYLHVPSPGLLDRFVKDGARRFIFEGRECGGHVGPRSSFSLWEAQIERLTEVADPESLQILLAGGIHDGRSAAMAAAAAAPLAARGAQIGVLMGTAYLFTPEAVAGGAITETFQEIAVGCTRTVLLETAPGHATRCVETDFVRAFAARRDELIAAGVEPQARWAELETLNLGRLRMASKGVARDGSEMVELDDAAQRRDGMFMIGEVATLHDTVQPVAELHRSVSAGSLEVLAATAPETLARATDRPAAPAPHDVAIIGMASMFPGAADSDRFWANIVAGVNSVTEVPAERWDVDRYYDPEAVTRDAGRKTPSRWGGFLEAVGFDPLAYGIPPASLAAIEPVQLLSLEVAARALADAGYATREFDRERASVVFGAESGNDLAGAYGFRAYFPSLLGDLPPELEDFLPAYTEDSFPGVLTNVIAGRIANRLDLGGINYTLDAACASSLAAVDAACKELVAGTSDLVVCGGADLHNGLNDYLLFASVHALSPTGQCRTFDGAADGIALGEGIAAVILKRRADAERDGDRVYAVIDAVAGSSDGRHLGLTAPRKEGQQRAVIRALDQAGHATRDIGLVEAHGTGTVVGDRTELATLTELYAEGGAEPGSAVVGSVKSQIGHTKCAAGLAGLIKITRALHHGVLPPTVNVVDPNPYWDPSTSPFRLLDRARPWLDDDRKAAVSAFGFGGTNFHAVLSAAEPDVAPHGLDEWPAELVLIRAETAERLPARVEELVAAAERIHAADPRGQRHRLRDLARTITAGGRGPVRAALVAADLGDLVDKLRAVADGQRSAPGVFLADDPGALFGEGEPTVAFVYPGQGSQRPGMLGELFVAFPQLRDLLRAGRRWVDVMLPPAAFGREARAAQQAAITATEVAQPTLGIAAMALTQLLGEVGVRPAMAGGHSYGELAALAAAGAFDTSTLLELSEIRGEAINAAIAESGGDAGAMAAVKLTRPELEARLEAFGDLVIANHNGPTQAVLSGPTASIEAAVEALTADGVKAKRIPVACAFHSPLVSAAADRLAAALDEVEIGELAFPVWSNVTAAPHPGAAEAPALLARQVAEGVRFVEQIEAMHDAGARVFVEAGPGRVLTQQIADILGDRPHRVIATDVSGENGITRLLLALAELATLGVPVDPTPLFEGRAALVELRSLPVPTPGWTVDGMLTRTADGRPVAGGLQPATAAPQLSVGALGGAAPAGGAADHVVLEYLRSVRELVAAERDVMLGYLGAPVAPASGPALPTTTWAEVPATAALAATASAGSAPAPAAPGIPSGEALLEIVLTLVSDRTGYPVDMLDPDLDLEADLSIDSIKRIEIIGELAETIGLGSAEDAIDESVVEDLAAIKSLRGIVAWIDEFTSGATGAAPAGAVEETDEAEADGPAAPERTLRFAVEPVALGPVARQADLEGQRVALLVPAEDGGDRGPATLAGLIESGLLAAGAKVDTLTVASGALDDATEAEIRDADAVVHLGATLLGADARDVFPALAAAALGGAARILALTLRGQATGVPGLLRAIAREAPEASCRALEIDPTEWPAADPQPIIEALVAELADEDGPVEVRWIDGQRQGWQVVAGDAAPGDDGGLLALPDGAVTLVTGGARGITASVAEALAAATGTRLVLVGSSPAPEAEDERLAGADDGPALRKRLVELGEHGALSEIEAAIRRITADRQIRATLARLAEAGVEVEYHSCDVRDAEALGALVDDVVGRHGRLDGIVHGAGVLDDRFLRDKTLEGFERVYATKVDPARVLLDRAPDTTSFVVLFGSISGVFGNRGQVDYGAANDTLDALARQAPDGGPRVISVDWGPWAGGGMVSPELEREYARRGIGLVDPDEGIALLLDELRAGAGAARQIVVMRSTPEALAP